MSIAKPQTASLPDTLNRGFSAINRRLWVLIIPLLLNVYLWYGPQFSFQPLFNNLAQVMESAAPVVEGVDPQELYAGWRELGQRDLAHRMDWLRLVPTLSIYAMGDPALQVLPFPAEQLPLRDAARTMFAVESTSQATLVLIAINALLLPLSGAFLALVAGSVRGDAGNKGRLRRVLFAIAALLGYAALLLAASVVLMVPLMMLSGLLALVSPPLGLLVLLLVLTIGFWLNIYLGFAPEAIALGGLEPVQALRASFMLVRRHFWSTIGFLVVTSIITVGLGVVWYVLVANPFGLALAIIGSAYIGSGLVAARMVFYQERAM